MVRAGNGTPRSAVREDATTSLKPLVLAIGLALGIGVGAPALAATYTVSNLNDSGAGSLRDAVSLANSNAGADVIAFAPGVTGTIALASVINVTDQLSINGPGASLLTITPAAGAYALASTVSLAISDVTFAGGSGGPAAVGASGSLTLQSSVFSNNSGTSAGAVYFLYSSASISDCTFNNNTGTGSAWAGAVGGGGGGTLSVTRSTFNGNQGVQAGAIYSIDNTFVMTDSTVSGNTGGTLAGGIAISSGISTALTSEISNSTISGNVATSALAGGILVTQTGSGSTTLNLTSTIVANSTSNPGTVDIARVGASVTVSAANSLIRSGAGGINGSNTANIFGVDPLLGPLQNNGGPTWTEALLPGSPAIDTGSNPLVLANDQRGAGFARTAGSGTDIGAYEVQPPVAATAIPTLSAWGTVVLAALLGWVTFLTGFGRRKRNG